MKYNDLEDLRNAISSGDLVQVWNAENPHSEGCHILVLDSDRCSIWTESGCVFEVHPHTLLEQCLTEIGIEYTQA